MTTFVVANLGDATLNIQTSTLTTSGTVSNLGITFIKNASGHGITVTVNRGLSLVAIVDAAGNANTYPITIVASDNSVIGLPSGPTSYILTVPGQWVWLSDNGTNYSVIG